MYDENFYEGITRHTIQTPGFRTVYRHCGPGWEDAETIFLLHGSLASGRWWEPAMSSFAELLPGKYACYAPDLRSHGDADALPIKGCQSLADDMRAVMDAIGIKRAHIVGWSLGGGPAMLMALSQPERCLSLTLVSSLSPYGTPQLTPANRQAISEALARGDKAFLERVVRSGSLKEGRFPTNGSPPGEALFSYLLQSAMQLQNYPGDENAGEGSAVAMQTFYAADRTPTAPFKVLSIHGDADPIISNEYFAKMRQAWSPDKFEEVIFEGSGHSPHVEQPRRFAAALDEFFDTL
jgi:pimeloyl-ACP methyl ester carboxylesterase